MVFDRMAANDHEEVAYFHDAETGLRCIIGIYDTSLGPALGGTRIWDYESEEAALTDVLRLSKGMAYKSAAAELDLGGGKAVIMGDPDEVKTDALLQTYGRAVQSLHGRYITAEDVNTHVADMDVVAATCDYVVGLSEAEGGLGDPSPVTAHGVLHGIKAAIHHANGDDDLNGVTVLVQGVGKVGGALVELLVDAGADVTISDIDADAVQELADEHGVDTVDPEQVYETDCDVFAPCALGGVINDDTAPKLQCDIVAGSANNVLDERRHAVELRERGILYAPDYVINAGGLITVYHEMRGGTKEAAKEETAQIHGRLESIFQRADDEGISTVAAADEYAEERMDEAREERFGTLESEPIEM